MLQRRNNRRSVAQGGWNWFFTGWEDEDHLSTSNHYAMRGNGNDPAAWPGWCVSPKLEAARDAWFDAPDEATQRQPCMTLQRQVMLDLPSIPVGKFHSPTVYNTRITGVLPGFAAL